MFDKYFSELCAQHPTLELLARPSEPLSHGCIKAMPLTCRRRRRPGRRADHFRFIIYLCSTICVCDSTRNRRLLSRQLVSQVSEAKQPRSMARSAQAVSALDTSFQHKNHICESVAAPIFVLHVSEAKQARSMVRSAQTIPSQRIQLQAESRMEQPESGGVNHANILLQVSEAKQARSMARSAQADQLADAARLLIRSLAGAHCRRHVCRCLRGDLCLRLATSSTLLCCLQWRSACASRCQPGRALRGAATVDATPRHSAGLEAYDGTNSFRLSGSFSESYHVGCAGAAPPGSSQHSSGGAAAVLWPAALRLLVAALRLTNDRRQRGFTGAVLQVLLAPIMVVSQDVVTVACCRVPGAGCRVPGAGCRQFQGPYATIWDTSQYGRLPFCQAPELAQLLRRFPAAAPGVAAAAERQLLLEAVLLTLSAEALGDAAAVGGGASQPTAAGSANAAGVAAFQDIASWALAAAATPLRNRWRQSRCGRSCKIAAGCTICKVLLRLISTAV